MYVHENVFHKSKIVQYLKELIQLYDIQSLATLDCIECLCRSDLRCLRMAAEIYKCIKDTLNSFEICLHKPDLDWTKFTYTCTLKNVHRKRYLYLSFLGLSCYSPGTYEPRVLHVLEDTQTFNRQKRLFKILESCKELHNLNPDIDDYSHIITYCECILKLYTLLPEFTDIYYDLPEYSSTRKPMLSLVPTSNAPLYQRHANFDYKCFWPSK